MIIDNLTIVTLVVCLLVVVTVIHLSAKSLN
jgi:hypothetical protein